jgi:hypothetical protein
MTTATRRTFLAAAGTGAAAAAIVGHAAASSTSADADDQAVPLEASFVVYVQDDGSGTLTVLTGEDEKVLRDPELVRRLTRTARA